MLARASCCPGCGGPFTLAPGAATATRRGSFLRADGRPVPRYQCKSCGRHFSAQTFRADYRRRRSHLDAMFARLLREGYSVRATARLLGVTRRTVKRRVDDRQPSPLGAARATGCGARLD